MVKPQTRNAIKIGTKKQSYANDEAWGCVKGLSKALGDDYKRVKVKWQWLGERAVARI